MWIFVIYLKIFFYNMKKILSYMLGIRYSVMFCYSDMIYIWFDRMIILVVREYICIYFVVS